MVQIERADQSDVLRTLICHDRAMQGGDEGNPGIPTPPPPNANVTPSDTTTPTPTGSSSRGSGSPGSAGRRPVPTLPTATPGQAAPAPPVAARPAIGARTWYRTDQDRNKSLRRRVDPWYRRSARRALAVGVLGGLAVGLYFGTVAVQDYVGRDRLPSVGADVPEIRSTSFLIRSRPPGPVVDGTLTIDTASGAFEFDGRAGGAQAGIRVVSPNGSSAYVRRPTGEWELMADDEADQAQLRRQDLVRVVQYLSDDDTADAILTDRVRGDYVDLIEQTTEGLSDNERTRYDLEIDTLALSIDSPTAWRSFLRDAIPGARDKVDEFASGLTLALRDLCSLKSGRPARVRFPDHERELRAALAATPEPEALLAWMTAWQAARSLNLGLRLQLEGRLDSPDSLEEPWLEAE